MEKLRRYQNQMLMCVVILIIAVCSWLYTRATIDRDSFVLFLQHEQELNFPEYPGLFDEIYDSFDVVEAYVDWKFNNTEIHPSLRISDRDELLDYMYSYRDYAKNVCLDEYSRRAILNTAVANVMYVVDQNDENREELINNAMVAYYMSVNEEYSAVIDKTNIIFIVIITAVVVGFFAILNDYIDLREDLKKND